ncbi:DUF2442 domain-containing protein [Dyadobacter sp. CY326]|uniref:DUF2442 domain-containing protein n=1 Tax=Dyadobacter sp. CY326 TaxID=2907300 RepID=UPI001F2AB0B2|nr:DUF2442 domain-containing protein [Dyadobacter sp. CY326]MCE7064489.1 DUF2442 domain-containing protein [Dyadobacter sp. CY326]
MILVIRVIDAEYISEYKVLVKFNDGTQQIVDFEDFLKSNAHPQHNKFRNQEHFRKFKIEKGTLVWGQNWDLIFPVEQLHAGHIQF